MRMSRLLESCLTKAYVHAPEGGDYATERRGNVLYVYLEGSDGAEDWKNNLDFPIGVSVGSGALSRRCHRGFLRVWKAMEPMLKKDLLDRSVEGIVISGYSHGGALAVLCHEYVWRYRPDLRERMEGYGFGAPRVLWGVRNPQLLSRWKRFTVVRNLDDLVTHLPPVWLGYYHVGRVLEIGARGRYSSVDAHRAENLLTELRAYESGMERENL